MYVFIGLASLGGGPYAHYGRVGAIPTYRVYRLSDYGPCFAKTYLMIFKVPSVSNVSFFLPSTISLHGVPNIVFQMPCTAKMTLLF